MILILASQSPRRQELLTQAGFIFSVEPANIDETLFAGELASQHVARLAVTKAQEIARQHQAPAIILGADTVVVLDGKILGKPKDAQEAMHMLTQLSGRVHEVMTGWSLVKAPGTVIFQEIASSKIHFRPLTKTEIKNYVATNEPLDKAGAYAIQGEARSFIVKTEGLVSTVIGLPIEQVSEQLKKWGLP